MSKYAACYAINVNIFIVHCQGALINDLIYGIHQTI